MPTTKTLVHAVIISHIDYADSLLFGISQHLVDKLQRVQNAAARLILGYRKYDSITPGLVKLHWLPVRYRIRFKIATITFKVLSTNEPAYLCNLLDIQPFLSNITIIMYFGYYVLFTCLVC